MRFKKLDGAGNTAHEFENKLKKAYAYLRCTDFSELTDGKHDVCSDFYVVVSRYETQPETELRFESHRRYADIHYILSGSEEALVADLSQLAPDGEFDAEGDCALYKDTADYSRLLLTKGSCAVFMPDDCHKTRISPRGETQSVEKVVVKVRV